MAPNVAAWSICGAGSSCGGSARAYPIPGDEYDAGALRSLCCFTTAQSRPKNENWSHSLTQDVEVHHSDERRQPTSARLEFANRDTPAPGGTGNLEPTR